MLKFIRKTTPFLIILIFLELGFLWLYYRNPKTLPAPVANLISQKPCAQPLYYSIGTVDERFKISPAELAAAAERAERLWETALGQELFVNQSGADFKINLIFDIRQQQTIEEAEVQAQLLRLREKGDQETQKYLSTDSTYQKKLAEYEAHLAVYEKKLEEYNKEASRWNKKGGAPPDEYEALNQERQKLRKEADNLEEEWEALNLLSKKLETAARQGNAVIEAYNQKVETYQNRFGTARQFEQGVFQGDAINIYQFRERSDLEAVLVHELGHALGLDHLENPQAIMHPLLRDQDLQNLQLTVDDIRAAKIFCGLLP